MHRIVCATLLSLLIGAAALGEAPAAGTSDTGSAVDLLATPDQVLAAVLRESIGAPARADLDDQATDRLTEDLLIIPREPGARLLAVQNQDVPPGFEGLLMGSEGLEAAGIIRFVPAGFIDAGAVLGWSADDLLASLEDTVERGNPERLRQNLQEQGVRQWVRPPHYDPETHQLSWAALILPKSAPRESEGEFTYHAIGFGREGYIHLTVVTSVEKTDEIASMASGFLQGLAFRPGKAYSDAVPADRRAPGGLASAMGIDQLRKAEKNDGIWNADIVVPAAGAIVATIGALALFIYIRRHFRSLSRRV